MQAPENFRVPDARRFGPEHRDLVDVVAQKEADELTSGDQLAGASNASAPTASRNSPRSRWRRSRASAKQPDRTILCLSGGGSYGAYAAGVLSGWSQRGDRPTFDVVTGISTGALIAPAAFLGPKYDAQLKQFYTTMDNKQVFTVSRFCGLFDESYADTRPLAARIDAYLSPELLRDLAEAHNRAAGSTSARPNRRGGSSSSGTSGRWRRAGPGRGGSPSSSIGGRGAVPSVPIDVEVDGVSHTERHVDGGVSQALFYRPPFIPASERSNVAARDLAGTKVYVILAGKLYADPEVIRPWALDQAGKNISTLIYT